MTGSIITAAITAAAMGLTGVLAYLAQNRGTRVDKNGLVMESYDELVTHLRNEVSDLRKAVEDGIRREERCDAKVAEITKQLEFLTSVVNKGNS